MGTRTHEVPPQKRARGGGTTKGILKAAGSAADPPRASGQDSQMRIDSKPKAVGHRAERLATPSAQGIYHQTLPGPSFQQGRVLDAANGKLTWVEGSVDEVRSGAPY